MTPFAGGTYPTFGLNVYGVGQDFAADLIIDAASALPHDVRLNVAANVSLTLKNLTIGAATA